MRKIISIAVVALLAVSVGYAEEATEQDNGTFGVGYQGIFVGDMINALSLRLAPAPIGGQIMIGHGSTDAEGMDTDIMMIKGKCFVSLVERENSDFYVGASAGYYALDSEGYNVDGFSIAPLMGVEWYFQGLPELGFNFEVSYEFSEFDAEGNDVDIFGINVSSGIHYYF